MVQKMEVLFSELFEASGVGRRWGEHMAAMEGQTQARWQTLWTAGTGQLTVPQIARRLGVSRQNVQRVVGELAAEELICYQPNPDHKTSPIVALTPLGREKLDRINAAADHLHRQLLESFPDRDVDTLRALLQQFTTVMKALGADEELHPLPR